MREEKLQIKSQIVEEIKEKIEGSQSLVLVDYRGLNVEAVTELRAKYREMGVEYKVYKNTLMKRAFNELGHEGLNEYLNGPNAIAFSMQDPVAAAKVTSDFAKTNDQLEIKVGVVDGKIISKAEVENLAKLPPKEVLIAQVLGGLNSPIQGLANVLNGTIKSLAVVMAAIRDKKGEEATA